MREFTDVSWCRKTTGVVAAVLFALLATIGAVVVPTTAASAADLSQFKPGNIISDAVFHDTSTMSQAQIQSFLNGKVSTCAAGKTCLKDFSQSTYDRAADAMCDGYRGAANESAASIIFKVAQSCGVNPQVILVMLQKEQGLVQSSAPSAWAWQASMGYACPDTAACDTKYFGFYNQVYMGIWQLKRYGNPPGTSNYFTWFPVGKPAQVRYSPNASCGSSAVTMENKATAALYYYTPYQPNDAALAAGYGASNDPTCSAYGNRNFYNYFTDWFGSTKAPAPTDPFGNVEVVQGGVGAIRVAGWAIDPNVSSPIDVHVYVDGVGKAYTASAPRADVGGAHPASGPNHGFDVQFPIPAGGSHSVCVYGINSGPGANTLFGCWDTTTPGGDPLGHLDPIQTDATGIRLSGWAIDPDIAGPISVHVYVGAAGKALTANKTRGDIPAKYAAYGTNHGISETIPAAAGPHTVCAYGINVGTGANSVLGCQTVTVPNASSGIVEKGRAPVGALSSVTADASGISVSGWAIDPDTASAIPVHVYVDSVGKAIMADGNRSDLPAEYAAYGPNHGYSLKAQADPGSRTVCAYAINNGAGGNVALGCKTVVVPTASSGLSEQGRVPIGNFETISAVAGKITVSGWAIDPDTADSIPVHVYVGSTGVAMLADKSRPDVALHYPAYGDKHGYSATLSAAPGVRTVCVYSINSGPGGNVLQRCENVTVPAPPSTISDQGRAPFGNLEAVVPTATGFQISGWAIDPDTTAPIAVHLYVGSIGTAVAAEGSREDVAASYPTYGPHHGFSASVAAPSGTSTVCAYGINNGAGGHTLIGCQTVTR
ncbi:hypothetical protein [Mycetocola sp.]|uniref:hypothetical protein n=1 Tax=Mycetocola sp. TaxID=1871042 RepID=UPI00398972F9